MYTRASRWQAGALREAPGRISRSLFPTTPSSLSTGTDCQMIPIPPLQPSSETGWEGPGTGTVVRCWFYQQVDETEPGAVPAARASKESGHLELGCCERQGLAPVTEGTGQEFAEGSEVPPPAKLESSPTLYGWNKKGGCRNPCSKTIPVPAFFALPPHLTQAANTSSGCCVPSISRFMRGRSADKP